MIGLLSTILIVISDLTDNLSKDLDANATLIKYEKVINNTLLIIIDKIVMV